MEITIKGYPFNNEKQNSTNISSYFQGFRRILFTPDEAAQIIAACEERLLKARIIDAPFTVADIQGGDIKRTLIRRRLCSSNSGIYSLLF